MSKHRMNWSAEKKLEIVQHFKQNGIAKTTRAYEVSSVNVYKWERKLNDSGVDGLADKTKVKRDVEFNQLKRERDLLMKLVAEKEIIISIQKDLLKKTTSQK
jgi:transposase-like protein